MSEEQSTIEFSTPENYNEDHIKTLEGLAHVRLRPGM